MFINGRDKIVIIFPILYVVEFGDICHKANHCIFFHNVLNEIIYPISSLF